MKKLKIILVILLMFICTTTINAEEVKKHNFDNTIKVYDYAQVLSDDVEEEKLKELALSYIKKHNIDMVLITSRHDKGTDTKGYMKKFYETYNFGIGETKDGIIIVIDFNGTDVNTEILSVGKAKDIYNDNRISNMLNNIKSNEKYFDKFKEFIKEADSYAKSGAGSNTIIMNKDNILSKIPFVYIIIFSSIIPTIIVFILLMKTKKEKIVNVTTSYLKDDSLVINSKSDKFVTTHTESSRIHEKSKDKREENSSDLEEEQKSI